MRLTRRKLSTDRAGAIPPSRDRDVSWKRVSFIDRTRSNHQDFLAARSRPLRLRASHDPLELRDIVKIRDGSGRPVPFSSRLGARRLYLCARICALVLEPGICHVLHRTALLSQLVTAKREPRTLGQLRKRSAARTRARRTAARTSSCWPTCGAKHAAQRLPPGLKGPPRAQDSAILRRGELRHNPEDRCLAGGGEEREQEEDGRG
jgi:hypothetical protein